MHVVTDDMIRSEPDKVLSKLNTSEQGLSEAEAKIRLQKYGSNHLGKKKRRSWILALLHYFKNPLIIILLIASVVAFFIGETVDSIIIACMVLLSVLLDFFQEHKAERAADALERRIATTATVVRGGKESEIHLSDIVPGDVIKLSAGDIIPADARVIAAKDFFIDQSALTGESIPVEKYPECISHDTASIQTWTNYLFMGTAVISGTATAVVVKTGQHTEYGEIVRKTLESRPATDFERGLNSFGMLIMKATFALVAFVFITQALFKSIGVFESLLFAIALAVGLTPELLPMILSINLSKGAVLMSHKGVIVKRLSSIENFGAMDVLCTDKTGTLTQNHITLFLHVDPLGKEDKEVFKQSFLNSHYQTGLKSPLDHAILSHPQAREFDAHLYEKIDEIPFDHQRKKLSVVVTKDTKRWIVTKGAPEEIIKVCSHYRIGKKELRITHDMRKKIDAVFEKLSVQGFMVLSVATKDLHDSRHAYNVHDEDGMTLLGFVAFLDPPKESAKHSLEQLKEANIALKILTGDNELVTRKVCDEIGFVIHGSYTGAQISTMDDDDLYRAVENANVFTRVTPTQKNRIMLALKHNNHTVGFIGDGINDTPSMKVADVSISVENAVDIAKESADIILLHKDLTVLKEGVVEGRKTFGNTMKYIMMGLSSNFGNMFSAAAASVFLPFLPMMPTQILLNNMMYDVSQVTLTSDNVDKEYIERPKKMDIKFVRRFMLTFGPISSLFDFMTFAVLIFVFRAQAPLFQTAWFIESLATQTLVIFVIRTRRPFWKSRASAVLTLSMFTIVALAIIIPYTRIGAYFGFTPPPVTFLLLVAVFVVIYLFLAEWTKRWFYKKYSWTQERI